MQSNTFVQQATHLIYRDILTGKLRPGEKLRIASLAKHYKMGATPIREALTHLCPIGFVISTANRGFRVRATSREDLEDIVGTRLVVEIEALKRSMEFGDANWEAEILSSLHKLKKRMEHNAPDYTEGDPEFDHLHEHFHTSLIAGCGLPRLIQLHEMFYDQTYRYRCYAFKNVRPARFIALHTSIAKLVIARDVEAACEALTRHIRSTLVHLYPSEEERQRKAIPERAHANGNSLRRKTAC